MKDNPAVNIPEKTAADARQLIKDFNELVKSRSPHELSEKEKDLIKDLESLIELNDDHEVIEDAARESFWRVKDLRENWYRKK